MELINKDLDELGNLEVMRRPLRPPKVVPPPPPPAAPKRDLQEPIGSHLKQAISSHQPLRPKTVVNPYLESI